MTVAGRRLAAFSGLACEAWTAPLFGTMGGPRPASTFQPPIRLAEPCQFALPLGCAHGRQCMEKAVVVGLAQVAVKEPLERAARAIINCGYP